MAMIGSYLVQKCILSLRFHRLNNENTIRPLFDQLYTTDIFYL